MRVRAPGWHGSVGVAAPGWHGGTWRQPAQQYAAGRHPSMAPPLGHAVHWRRVLLRQPIYLADALRGKEMPQSAHRAPAPSAAAAAASLRRRSRHLSLGATSGGPGCQGRGVSQTQAGLRILLWTSQYQCSVHFLGPSCLVSQQHPSLSRSFLFFFVNILCAPGAPASILDGLRRILRRPGICSVPTQGTLRALLSSR